MKSHLFILVSILVHQATAHSWLECVNYENNEVAAYDKSKCKGFPRDFVRQFPVSFGVDTGFNSLDHTQKECPVPYKEGQYNDRIVMAKVVPGQDINLVWPAKNHVANNCAVNPNPFIPDGGVIVYRSSDPSGTDYSKVIPMNGEPHQLNTVDFKGFQRCFDFCSMPDKSPCYESFKLDNDFTQSGIYSFKWIWTFNPGEYYITCFDMYVDVNGSPSMTPSITSTPTPSITNSSSGSNDGDNTSITFPPTGVPTPMMTTTQPTPVPETPSPTSTNSPVSESPTPVPETPSPSNDEPTTQFPIISSDAARNVSFIAHFISGMINITGWINETIYQ